MKSHQPVRATSGLGFSFHPPSLQLFLSSSTPSSNSGGVVYPSSFLLPWLQNRPGALTRSRLYTFFSPSWSSSFFLHFPNTLFFDFGPILDPNLVHFKIAPKKFFSNSEITSYDFLNFATCVLLGFEGPSLRK